MKMLIATILSVFALSIEAMANDAQNQKTDLWLARETKNVSCAEENNYSELSSVIKDAQAVGLRVTNAQVGYFKGQAFCMACGCPEGSYYLIKVEEKDGIDNLIVGRDLKKVDENDLVFKR